MVDPGGELNAVMNKRHSQKPLRLHAGPDKEEEKGGLRWLGRDGREPVTPAAAERPRQQPGGAGRPATVVGPPEGRATSIGKTWQGQIE